MRFQPLLVAALLANALSVWAESPCGPPLRVIKENLADPAPGLRAPSDDRDILWMEAILREAGCDLSYVTVAMQVRRRLDLIARGELDIVPGASRLPEREAYAHFSAPYRTVRIRLFVSANRADEFTLSALDELLTQGLHVGAPAGGWYGPEFQTLRPRLAEAGLLHEYRNAPQALTLLLTGRIDVLLGFDAIDDYLETSRKDLIATLPLLVHEEPTHLILSRKTVSPATLLRLDQAIARLKARGYEPAREHPHPHLPP